MVLIFVQACRVLCGPEFEVNALEAGSHSGPGEGGQHKVSSPWSWNAGLQCSQDAHGTTGRKN